MMLKRTAQAFAAGAALHLGVTAAQEDSLIPPGPGEAEFQTENVPVEPRGFPEASGSSQDFRQDADEALRDARDEDRRDVREQVIERESRYAPNGAPTTSPQIDGRVQAATQGLQIDDETRSRYRWHNGEWWFKTRSGQWKFYREGRWQDFDPTTYEPLTRGGASYSPQSGGDLAAPQTFSSGGSYYDAGRGYSTIRPNDYRGDLNRTDGRLYGGSRNYDGRYDGRYYDPRLNNQGLGDPRFNAPGYGYQGPYGAGYRGYDPGTDRYYGVDPYGRGNSISGQQYRRGVIGSEIGGRIGGNTGAIIGGALGAGTAD